MRGKTHLTGYASVDRPWMKYYSENAQHIEPPKLSMYEYVKQCNEDRPEGLAIEYFNWKITIKEFFQKIDHVSAGFAALGVKAKDIVTLAIPNIPENVLAVYALNRIGAISNLIDLRLSGAELEKYFNEVRSDVIIVSDVFLQNTLEILKNISAKTVIVASPYAHLPKLVAKILKMKDKVKIPKDIPGLMTWEEFENKTYEPVPVYHSETVQTDVASIMHTSGTTGASKGVMLTNNSFNVLAQETYYIYGDGFFKEDSRMMNQVPPFLAYNVSLSMHSPLCQRVSLVLLPDYRPDKFAANLFKYKPNHVAAGPADWMNFVESPAPKGRDYGFLYTAISGSDSIRYENKVEINKVLSDHGSRSGIIEGYGMTECGCAVTTNRYGVDKKDTVGIPFPTLTVCIYDNENDCELPYGEKGEICVAGPRLMKGYFERPEDTAESLRYHADGRLWMHTGDLGAIDEDGYVYIEGRLKRIIIQHNGMKINPFEIETVIAEVPQVQSCCVVGQPDEEHGSGQRPVAYFVLNPEHDLSEEEVMTAVKTQCEEKLTARYQPQEFHILDALPLTPNGKVDYQSLEKIEAE